MEYEEIFKEDNIDTNSENINSDILDNSVNEVEKNSESDEIDTVDSILLLLEERLREQEEDNEEGEVPAILNEGQAAGSSPVPVAVSVENETDYTDMLLEIHHKLDDIVTNQEEILEYSRPSTLDTTLVDMPLNTILLISILICFIGYVISKTIKSLVFKL